MSEPKLTPRQDVTIVLSQKLNALGAVGRHMGLWGQARVDPSQLPHPRVPLWFVLCRVFDETAHPIQRRAAELILEAYRPSWRRYCPPQLLGKIVERDSVEVARWRKDVLSRDGLRCRGCGASGRLHVHHVVHWADAPELRLDVNNGVALCADCHAAEHPDIAGLISSGTTDAYL